MSARSTASPTAHRILALAMRRPPTLGRGRLVCVDGPSGAGKTTLARDLRRAARGRGTRARVVHLDDLYPGWDGLPRVGAVVQDLLAPLARAEPGSYPRWDWHRDARGEQVPVPPVDLLVLEGVGAGQGAWAELTTCLVWLEEPADALERGVRRDGEQARERLVAWKRAERAHFAADQPWLRADLVVPSAP